MCNGTISATASANHYFSLDTFNFTPPHTGVRIVSMCNAPFTPIKERILEYHELLQNEWVFGIGGMEIKVLGEGRRKLVDEFGRFLSNYAATMQCNLRIWMRDEICEVCEMKGGW